MHGVNIKKYIILYLSQSAAGGLHGDADENSVLLGCCILSLGQCSLTFCIEVLPSSSEA